MNTHATKQGGRWIMSGSLAAGWMAAAVALAPGCSRDPLERTVSVRNASAFATWRAQVVSDSGQENRRRVDEALQEIRQKVAAEREVKRVLGEPVAVGADTIDEVLRQRVDGRPLREVLQLGYELRVQRLGAELAALEDAIDKNAQLVTKPGDLESKHHLDGLRGRQTARVETYRDDLAKAERELEPLLKATGRRLLPAETEKPNKTPAMPEESGSLETQPRRRV